MPDVYRIKAKVATDVPRIAEEAQQIEGVENVRYGQGLVEKLLALTHWLRTVGLVVILAVGLAAIFLIATTIRLTVFARRREINIMKLVGADKLVYPLALLSRRDDYWLHGCFDRSRRLNLFYVELTRNVASTINFVSLMSDKHVLFSIYEYLLLMEQLWEQ